MTPEPIVRFGNMRIAHHAAHSGYHLLAGHVARAVPDAAELTPGRVGSIWGGRAGRSLLARTGREWYDEHSLGIEAAAVKEVRARPGRVVHLLWGESLYRLSWLAPRTGALAATFHQPPSWFAKVGPPRRTVAKLDAVFALSEGQRAFFAEMLGDDRVFVLPHGVDTTFFSPGPEPRSDAVCLVVGQWLRDNETLAAAARILHEKAPEVRIQMVGAGKLPDALRDAPNVIAMPRLTDEELLEEYRKASLLLLPLTDSTANCGLLEGLATGTPIVCTDVGGVRDYAGADSARFVPASDGEALSEAVLEVLASDSGRAKMAAAAASRSTRFDWEAIASDAVGFYQRLL